MKEYPAHPWAVIPAAGSGSRLAEAGLEVRKQYISYDGKPLFWHSVLTFARVAAMRGVVLVVPAEDVPFVSETVNELVSFKDPGVPVLVVAGGARRQDSVRLGIAALPRECDAVLVHDAARPFASAGLTTAMLGVLAEGAQGVIPAIAVKDTVKRVEGGAVSETLVRSELRAVQTPQAFERAILEKAHRMAEDEGWQVTDDASMVERLGTVRIVEGEESNVKITTPADLEFLNKSGRSIPCTGWGYDVHRFGGDRPLVLGGVPIPGSLTIVAHSDGDVLLHALCDAVLGTFGGGDIGRHFPDTDPKWSGADSSVLFREVLEMAHRAGVDIVQADLTVITQVPKLSPHAAGIARNVARLLGLDESFVNFKATTEEKLGFTGEKKGIKAVACVTGIRKVS